MTDIIRAWHFTGETLRDGRPVPKPGVWLKHDGPIVWCNSGLYASRSPFDALRYVSGNTLHLVECRGIEQEGDDKFVCRERRIVASMDAEDLLYYYARMQALAVVHLWDAPQVVLDYLMTGDVSIRAAARDAARDAAWAAARDAAWAAARDAARAAAWAAARDATNAAAWAAAWDTARNTVKAEFEVLVHESFEEWLR